MTLAAEIDGGAIGMSVAIFAASAGAVWLGWRPLMAAVRDRQARFDRTLRDNLLLEVSGGAVIVGSLAALALLAAAGYMLAAGVGGAIGAAAGLVLPSAMLGLLVRRRLNRLEDQLVSGVQTLSSGVRAGLNLVQAMRLIARDGPAPISQEFAHLLREYEYGVPLEQAMDKAAARIGSGDYRLLFAALRTHRERGGDLGTTLDRIAESIREIQRLEKRVRTLTAQGRTTARWLAAMPAVVLGILYLIDRDGTIRVFQADVGKLILLIIVVMNVAGFLWIKKITSVDL